MPIENDDLTVTLQITQLDLVDFCDGKIKTALGLRLGKS